MLDLDSQNLSPEREKPGPPSKKRTMPASRIALLVFVALASVAIVWELQARWSFNRSFQTVEKAMTEGERSSRGLYRKDLDDLLYGFPVREYDETAQTERITWCGVYWWRPFRMQVTYGRGEFVSHVKQQ
jgi:hypothetical protein